MKLLYAAFDAYPGYKGAQAHIRSNLMAAKENGYSATLLCLGGEDIFQDPETAAAVHAFPAPDENLLKRSEAFGRFILSKADAMTAAPPDIIHFRDIWSGMPLLGHSVSKKARTVYEVNGLPSVELPGRFPRLARNSSLLQRLRAMEDECLTRSDRVVTIASRTARYLSGRGCDPSKISIIPNSARPPSPDSPAEMTPGFPGAALSREKKVVLYTGTLAAWQGVPALVGAVNLLRHRDDLVLLIIASNRRNITRLRKYTARCGLGDRMIIHDRLPHGTIASLYKQAYACVAPLSRGPRNELQGCCPVKIVEAMANGVPVIASDLPVVREIVDDGVNGILAVPDSPRSLADALEQLLDDPSLRMRLSARAYEKAGRFFTARLYSERLGAVYTSLLGGNGNAVFDR